MKERKSLQIFIGGFVGPFAVGWMREATGSFGAGLVLLAAVLVAGAVVALSLRPPPERTN